MVSNYSQDPGLGIGWAYMLPRIPYESYVRSRMGDEDVSNINSTIMNMSAMSYEISQQISTCVGLQALAKAYTKYSEGQRYTGVGLVCCGRSEMVLPMAVGNLQKGERYEHIFNQQHTLFRVYLKVCQHGLYLWICHLFARHMSLYSNQL